jgi:hypothetical protein
VLADCQNSAIELIELALDEAAKTSPFACFTRSATKPKRSAGSVELRHLVTTAVDTAARYRALGAGADDFID